MFVFIQGKPVGTPDPGVYFRIIKEHNVAGLFVAPTALRAIRRDVSWVFPILRVMLHFHMLLARSCVLWYHNLLV